MKHEAIVLISGGNLNNSANIARIGKVGQLIILFKKWKVAMIINISEAKTKLSKLVEMACNGEKVIIAKDNLPLVELVAYKPKAKRKLGLLAGQIKIPDDFLNMDEEISKMFYG